MDNLDAIKFKHSVVGRIKKIDVLTGQVMAEFNPKKREGLNKELESWIDAGNEIEDQYTPEEQTQKDSDDAQNALDSQKSQCIQLLNDSEKSVSNDPPYPNDIETWKTARQQWRDIVKSNQIETIPDKPF